MDSIAAAVTVLLLGLVDLLIVYTMRRSLGWKGIAMLGAAGLIGVGGGIWMLWP